jgi:hypothetical protein
LEVRRVFLLFLEASVSFLLSFLSTPNQVFDNPEAGSRTYTFAHDRGDVQKDSTPCPALTPSISTPDMIGDVAPPREDERFFCPTQSTQDKHSNSSHTRLFIMV